ncbi:MAG: hypothetical protein J6W76_02610, partial [Spirochaetales bacterium]|nr:hypothetical protein [Spirochaetales bacterium]
MDEILKQKILFGISMLDEHISKADILIKKCKAAEPDYIELCAVGSMLHSYYNGIENILLLISKNIDEISFSSSKWHSELLNSMFEKTAKHPAVFPNELKTDLTNYMNFRHFFRHSYGYSLQWEKAAPLFLNMQENWGTVKKLLNIFL